MNGSDHNAWQPQRTHADYDKFNQDENIKDANIAATLLKITERKTPKGKSYEFIKITDLTITSALINKFINENVSSIIKPIFIKTIFIIREA